MEQNMLMHGIQLFAMQLEKWNRIWVLHISWVHINFLLVHSFWTHCIFILGKMICISNLLVLHVHWYLVSIIKIVVHYLVICLRVDLILVAFSRMSLGSYLVVLDGFHLSFTHKIYICSVSISQRFDFLLN